MCIFQLSESNDLLRISNILGFLAKEKDGIENVQYMVQKY
jgi:hypothetical protein